MKPSEAQLDALRASFVPAMVRVGAEGEYMRRPAQLVQVKATSRPLLEQFAKAPLLVVRQEADGPPTVEVAHEALLREWPLLRIDSSRDFLTWLPHIELKRRQWERHTSTA
jgi:hypothetical protein